MHYIAATLDRKRCWNRFSSLLNCPCYFAVHGTTAPPLCAATPPRRHLRSLHFLSKAVGLREGGVGVCPDKSGRAFPWHPWPKPCKGATSAAATPQPRCVVALFESVCRFVLWPRAHCVAARRPPRGPRVGKASSPPPCSLCHMDHRIFRAKTFNGYVSFSHMLWFHH